MSFQAVLKLDGKEIRVLHCSYALSRDVDSTGRPSSMTRGGQINFEVESTDDNSLFAWIAGQYDLKDGEVTFFKRDSKTTMKTLKWTNGYIIQFTESLDAMGENPMTIHFTVTAEKIESNDAMHVNPWPQS